MPPPSTSLSIEESLEPSAAARGSEESDVRALDTHQVLFAGTPQSLTSSLATKESRRSSALNASNRDPELEKCMSSELSNPKDTDPATSPIRAKDDIKASAAVQRNGDLECGAFTAPEVLNPQESDTIVTPICTEDDAEASGTLVRSEDLAQDNTSVTALATTKNDIEASAKSVPNGDPAFATCTLSDIDTHRAPSQVPPLSNSVVEELRSTVSPPPQLLTVKECDSRPAHALTHSVLSTTGYEPEPASDPSPPISFLNDHDVLSNPPLPLYLSSEKDDNSVPAPPPLPPLTPSPSLSSDGTIGDSTVPSRDQHVSVTWKPPSLPYYRRASELPAPLPTQEEIESPTEWFKADKWRHNVVLVGQHFVVKYGIAVRPAEGYSLLFVEENLQILAPKLFAMYYATNGWLCIVMEYLPGESLDKIWPALELPAKKRITERLRASYDSMRSLPSPGFYGTVSEGPLPHYLVRSMDRKNPALGGPFNTESDFNMSFAINLQAFWKSNKKHSYRAEFYERHLSKAMLNHPPTFTHSDLQRKNILVREIVAQGEGCQQEKDYEVALVDWEEAGWYPSYWEYCAGFIACTWSDDWAESVEQILDAWPAEAAMLFMINADLWPF